MVDVFRVRLRWCVGFGAARWPGVADVGGGFANVVVFDGRCLGLGAATRWLKFCNCKLGRQLISNCIQILSCFGHILICTDLNSIKICTNAFTINQKIMQIELLIEYN